MAGRRSMALVLACWAGALLLCYGGIGVGAVPLCRYASAEGQPAPPPSTAQPPPCPAAEPAPAPRIIPAAPSAYARTPQESLTTWVAKVNGDAISLALFTRRLAANRFSAYLHFEGISSVSGGEDFWTKEYHGEIPAQWLKQRTLEECVRIQVELGLGKGHHLIPDTAFYIIKCVERKSLGYHPFEEVEEPVTRMYVRQQYQALVDRLVKSAEVKINQAKLDRIEVR